MLNYRELYDLIGDLTPLPADCGRVCAAACCGGSEEEGMWLFPGEKVPGGSVTEQEGVRLFVCAGRCDRNARPLACRLFPLLPYLTKEGRVRVIYDPRAFRLCPLVRLQAHLRLQPAFVRSVAAVGYALRRDPEGKAFLDTLSRQADGINRFLTLEEARSPICRRKGVVK